MLALLPAHGATKVEHVPPGGILRLATLFVFFAHALHVRARFPENLKNGSAACGRGCMATETAEAEAAAAMPITSYAPSNTQSPLRSLNSWADERENLLLTRTKASFDRRRLKYVRQQLRRHRRSLSALSSLASSACLSGSGEGANERSRRRQRSERASDVRSYACSQRARTEGANERARRRQRRTASAATRYVGENERSYVRYV